MSADTSQSTALVVILSILGILAITLLAGILLFQKQETSEINLGSVLTPNDPEPPTDDFDPISWARDGAEYPPLLEVEDAETDIVADFTQGMTVPQEAAEPQVVQQPVAVSTPPVASPPPVRPKPAYREVRENAYWVQVFSSENSARAEDIREELTAKGFPTTVQAREVDGETWYRVRIGAFKGEAEAENHAETVRGILGYEASYVVLAPITRRIPTDG